MNRLIAFCGINCETCPLYIATKNDNYMMKQELATKWGLLYNRSFDIKDMECYGCKSEKRFFLSKGCDISTCNTNKDITTCIECSSHPCERINKFYEWQKKHDTKVEKVNS